MANQLNVTSLDTEDLKQSLIRFVQEKPEFSDIDYEGSAINTLLIFWFITQALLRIKRIWLPMSLF